MGLSLIRYADAQSTEPRWALLTREGARPIDAAWHSTGELIERGREGLRRGEYGLGDAIPMDRLAVLSPITHPCRVIAQAANYSEHAREIGLDPKQRKANILFRKSSAAITGPIADVVRPSHVRLLDYEVELGLVIGAQVRGPKTLTEANLADIVGGLVVTNDISARDVQVPEGQYYKGKSYRTFLPCGPILYLPDAQDLARWPELELSLHVNDQQRQRSTCAHMIHRPAETLAEISLIEDLDPGDLILTGTPGGVALRPPQGLLRAIAGALPDATRGRLFVQSQLRRTQYLRPGDRIRATIRTPDGEIDLGTQQLRVTAP